MAMGSLFTVTALFAGVLAVAGAGFYFYSRTRDSSARRVRRLAFIERAHLDGGRKLLLVRRDGVEHLILIGGPIDLVVETGIDPGAYIESAPEKDDYSYRSAVSWQDSGRTVPAPREAAPAEPRLSLTPKGAPGDEAAMELTLREEAKAAE